MYNIYKAQRLTIFIILKKRRREYGSWAYYVMSQFSLRIVHHSRSCLQSFLLLLLISHTHVYAHIFVHSFVFFSFTLSLFLTIFAIDYAMFWQIFATVSYPQTGRLSPIANYIRSLLHVGVSRISEGTRDRGEPRSCRLRAGGTKDRGNAAAGGPCLPERESCIPCSSGNVRSAV